MTFRRDVLSLEKLILKHVSKHFVPEMVTEEKISRAHRILKPGKHKSHKIKQEFLRAVLSSGRLQEQTIPSSFYHDSLTRLEVKDTKFNLHFITQLTTTCVKLHTLNLCGSFRLTDDAVKILVTHCTELKDLNIRNCRKLSNTTLRHITTGTPKLQAIDIGGNFNMTVEGITRFIEKHANHSKFVRLHISGHSITDRTIAIIANKCRKLHSLCIGYAAVSDEAIIGLLERRKSISKLHLHWNVRITDKLLDYISSSCPNMQDINLCGVVTVSAERIINTINKRMLVNEHEVSNSSKSPRTKRLKRIDFKYTNMTKDTSALVREAYPNLVVTS